MGALLYDDAAGLITASVIMEILAVSCVGLRFYSRRWKQQSFIVSDWLILVAIVFGTGLTVMEIYGVAVHALGYPIGSAYADGIALKRFKTATHIELAMLLLGIAGVGFVKLSVCFLYWHLFSKVVFRRFLIVWIVIISLWLVAFILTGFLECGTHLTAVFGEPQEYFEYCQAAVRGGYAMVLTDVVTDFVTLLIPVPVVLSMRLDIRTKLLALLTFMIGSLSVGGSIAKAHSYIVSASSQYTGDAILVLTGLSIWNLVEVQVGIIAACGPTLRQILGHILTRKA